MSLLRKLIFTFTILAFLPLALMAALLLTGQRQRLMDDARDHMRSLALTSAREFDLLLDRTVQQVQLPALSPNLIAQLETADAAYAGLSKDAVARRLLERDAQWSAAGDQDEVVQGLLTNGAARELRLLLQTAPERYLRIVLTDAMGGLCAATRRTKVFCHADAEWYKAAVQAGGTVFVGGQPQGGDSRSFSLDVAVPVRNMAGDVVGVLEVSHEISAMVEMLRDMPVGETGAAYLVDGHGKLLVAAVGGMGSDVLPGPTLQRLHSEGRGAFVGTLAASGPDYVIGHAVLQQTLPSSSLRVAGGPWAVMLAQDARGVYAPGHSAMLLTSVVLLLPASGLILLAFFLKKRLIEPIRALHWASEQIAAGNLDVRVQIGHRDEMELVGYQFNRMAAALQRHEDDQREEIRRRTEELRQTDLQARRVRETISAQLHSISKGMMDSLAHLRLDYTGESEGADAPAVVRAALARAKGYAEDVYDLCKIQGGRMHLLAEEVQVKDLLASALRVLGPLIEAYHSQMLVPSDGESFAIIADRAKVKQVLYAVISNAVKFSGQGARVTISVRQADGETTFGVRDVGPGVPPDEQEVIFTPLASQPKASETQEEKVGLSLSIAQQLVELHGGRIWVESAEGGRGSLFSFTLPPRGRTGVT